MRAVSQCSLVQLPRRRIVLRSITSREIMGEGLGMYKLADDIAISELGTKRPLMDLRSGIRSTLAVQADLRKRQRSPIALRAASRS